jgi:uncharacterized protein YciI
MKYFLMQASHGAPFGERSREALATYSRLLQQGHDEGRFLLSGLTIPSEGQILIGRAESLERLSDLRPCGSYGNSDVVQFDKIVEFAPIQHQFILNHWFEKYSG